MLVANEMRTCPSWPNAEPGTTATPAWRSRALQKSIEFWMLPLKKLDTFGKA